MIEYNKFELKNGLKIIHHFDHTTPMVVVNTTYDVGAKDENPEKTGFAHLFEHLMFGGSKNIPNFDDPLQKAGGSSNAFTSNDLTNYYCILPKENVETALWLESDRMLSLAFTEKSLEVQRNVVIEEFKQRYLNQPYGDVWMELRKLIYKKHPYQWATIGEKVEHIENATMEDVKSFFFNHYAPNNAILTIAGNISLDETKEKVEKWYNDIPRREVVKRNLPQEPEQDAFRSKIIERNVPNNAFYYAFNMPGKMKSNYAEMDLISDILGRGKSSRLYNQLKRKEGLVSEINSFVNGAQEKGLLIISGFLSDGVSFEEVDQLIWQEINKLKKELLQKEELLKIKNKFITTKIFNEANILPKALELSANELIGDIELTNTESEIYQAVSEQNIFDAAKHYLTRNNCSRLLVKSINDDK